jgi:hypothetical protein
MDWYHLAQGTLLLTWNESSGSMKGRKFLDWLKTYYFVAEGYY